MGLGIIFVVLFIIDFILEVFNPSEYMRPYEKSILRAFVLPAFILVTGGLCLAVNLSAEIDENDKKLVATYDNVTISYDSNSKNYSVFYLDDDEYRNHEVLIVFDEDTESPVLVKKKVDNSFVYISRTIYEYHIKNEETLKTLLNENFLSENKKETIVC